MPRPSKNATRAPPSLPSLNFVLDNGGHTIKAGFALGSLKPDDQERLQNCHKIVNALARTKDRRIHIATQVDDPTIQWNDAAFRRPVEHGQLVGWEAQREIWDFSFFDQKTAHPDVLIKEPENTTLVLTEAPNTMPALQKNADEIIMEEWGFGGYVRTVGSSLNAFNDLHPLFGNRSVSNGADESSFVAAQPIECVLVIDCGFSQTTVTPVYKGRPLQRAIRRLDFGGKYLTNLLREFISVRHADLHQDVKVVNDIKEDVCYVSQDFKRDMERAWIRGKTSSITSESVNGTNHGIDDSHEAIDQDQMASTDIERGPVVDYTLPDFVTRMRGSVVETYSSNAARTIARRRANKQRSAQTSTTAKDYDNDPTLLTLGNETFNVPEILFTPSSIGSTQPGLPQIVIQSLSTLPPLLQATFLANTLCVGGTAKLPGFTERLELELRSLVRDDWVVRVRKLKDPILSTWLGGARMSTDKEVVRKLGITKSEYEEYGWIGAARRFGGLV